jgi:hypothetical protein
VANFASEFISRRGLGNSAPPAKKANEWVTETKKSKKGGKKA